MKKFKKIWWNLILQFSIVCAMGAAYFFVRHGLPKKYRMSDATLNKLIKDIGSIVQNLSKTKDDLPTILNKSKNIFDHFLSMKNRNTSFEKMFKAYIEESMDEGTIMVIDPLFMSIFSLLESEGEIESSIMVDMQHMVYHYVFRYRNKEYRICVAKNVGDGPTSVSLMFLHGFAVHKDTQYYELSNILFEKFNNQISISLKQDQIAVSGLERVEPPENYKFPEDIYEEMRNDIERAKDAGFQRSFMLYGNPGTGKSTYVFEVSRRTCGKVLKLDPSILRSVEYVSATELKYLLEALDCDFILIDDIDRIQFGEISTLLFLLEVLKTLKNKATLLCTANNLSKIDTAVLRPGRIDDIYEFKLPDHEGRKQFIASTLKGYVLSDEELDKLANAMNGWTHAYIQEFCFQYPICGSTDKLCAKIAKRRMYLEKGRTHWNDDEEDLLGMLRDSSVNN